MNKFEKEIEKKYGSFELSHDKNKAITENIKSFTADVAAKFAEWISSNFWHYSDMEKGWVNMVKEQTATTEELFQIFINNHYGK